MSCFVVSDEHIDSLIATAIYGPTDTEEFNNLGRFHKITFLPVVGPRQRISLDLGNATELGRVLLEVNIAADRKRNGGGPNDDLIVKAYRFPTSDVVPGRGKRLTVVQALKALQCLEYQCEQGFESGDDASHLQETVELFISDLRRNLIQVLPGYEEAKWQI